MGPKNANEATLEALLDAGMDIMRLNFSHGSYEWFEGVIAMLRDVPGIGRGGRGRGGEVVATLPRRPTRPGRRPSGRGSEAPPPFN